MSAAVVRHIDEAPEAFADAARKVVEMDNALQRLLEVDPLNLGLSLLSLHIDCARAAFDQAREDAYWADLREHPADLSREAA